MSDEISYVDFELAIEKAGDEFLVRAETADGRAKTRFANPFEPSLLTHVEDILKIASLRSRSASTMRSSSSPEVREMKQFGATLFNQAMSGAVREFYDDCLDAARAANKGVRVRLSLDSSVEALPWEFMYSPAQDQFLALNPNSPIVRYIDGATQPAPLRSDHPLQVLVVIANPANQAPLETSDEKDLITRTLAPLVAKGTVEVTFIEGKNSWDRLCKQLKRDETHILHFIGHGAFDTTNNEGVLVMVNNEGDAEFIDSERLRYLVQGTTRLRLVVLNSCLGAEGADAQPFSSVAAGMVRSGIPAVIAMQFEISDVAARKIAESFYESLTLNKPVDAALTDARRTIFFSNRDSLEWATPILYMQVPDGQLFEFVIKETTLSPDSAPPTIRGAPGMTAVLLRMDTGTEFPLKHDLIRIGRGADNDINLPDLTVSRRHANLTRTGSSYMIQDVGGSSGTRVNGAQLHDARQLQSNDVVRVGTVELRFVSLVAKESHREQKTDSPAVSEPVAAQPPAEEALVRHPAVIQAAPQPSRGRLRGWFDQVNNMFAAPLPASRAAVGPAGQQRESQPPATDFESRLYKLDHSDIKAMAENVRQYFLSNGFESQMLQQNETWIVQGRKTGWLKWMKEAGTVIMNPEGDSLRVLIGGGGWLERGATWATTLYLKPEWVNNAFGIDQQKQLLQTLWQIAEGFITHHGGKRLDTA